MAIFTDSSIKASLALRSAGTHSLPPPMPVAAIRMVET